MAIGVVYVQGALKVLARCGQIERSVEKVEALRGMSLQQKFIIALLLRECQKLSADLVRGGVLTADQIVGPKTPENSIKPGSFAKPGAQFDIW